MEFENPCPLFHRIMTTDLSENLPLPYGMCGYDNRVVMKCDYRACQQFEEYILKQPVQLPLGLA